MSLSRLIARPLLASGFIYGAVTTLRNAEAVAPKAAKVTGVVVPQIKRAGVPLPEEPKTLVQLNSGVLIAGSLLLATGKAPRLGAAVIAGSLVPTTIAGHAFWSETDPTVKKTQMMSFFKNLSMIGGAMLAAGDTDGQPGLAWRARRAAKDAKREARTAAKLTKAKLS